MGKFTIIAAGIVGMGAAGTGGFLMLRDRGIPKTTFKERYKHAWLPEDSNLWDSKLTSLKSGKPVHPKLVEAANKGRESNQDASAKALMKNGCGFIYKEPFENSRYFEDFSKYCSKTNKEASNGNWNSDDKNNESWNSSLDALKSHDILQYGKLNSALLALKTELSSKNTPYDSTVREKLKIWCESVQINIFEGSESEEFKQQEKYCRKG